MDKWRQRVDQRLGQDYSINCKDQVWRLAIKQGNALLEVCKRVGALGKRARLYVY
jgi:hypothetical protein